MTARRYLEIFLLELILWLGLWLVSDYVATLLTVILVAIFAAVLVVSLLSEWIERTKVPRSYFLLLALSIAASLLTALFYMAVFGGKLSWIDN